jgi:RNA polymerase sigma factor (sigma-70 family)
LQNIAQLTEQELVTNYRQTGDKIFLGELFRRYNHLVFGVCMKYLKDEENSKDAVMLIFEKLMTELLKHEITHFKTWLYSVSKNHCLMYLRSEKNREEKLVEMKNNFGGVMESSGFMNLNNEYETESRLKNLEKGIDLLNEGQKICIELFYLKEMCYNEISEKTGYSLNEVKSYIQNGKRNLKNFLISRQ